MINRKWESTSEWPIYSLTEVRMVTLAKEMHITFLIHPSKITFFLGPSLAILYSKLCKSLHACSSSSSMWCLCTQTYLG